MQNNGDGFYWDSCVFLAYLNGEPNRDITIYNALKEITDRNQKIFTSTISIVEASHKNSEKNQNALDPDAMDILNKFWNNKSIIVVELNPIIAHSARNMIRDGLTKKYSLKPKDAVHIATAKFLNTYLKNIILEFHTYDGKLEKYDGLLGIPVKEPYCQQYQLIDI